MKVDKKLVEKVAKVARLNLSEREKKEFVKDFKEILDAFSELDEVNTKRVAATLHPVKIEESYLPDKVQKSLTQKQALANTSHKKKGYFKGPSST